MATVLERLCELGRHAAETWKTAEAYPDAEMRDAALESWLYLDRRRLFPETGEPSPFGRLEMLPDSKARIIRPGQ